MYRSLRERLNCMTVYYSDLFTQTFDNIIGNTFFLRFIHFLGRFLNNYHCNRWCNFYYVGLLVHPNDHV